MDVSEAQRRRQMEDENRRSKALVADLSLDREVLKSVIRRNGWSRLCEDMAFAQAEPGVSERRACVLLGVGSRQLSI
jgi:putative transposase